MTIYEVVDSSPTMVNSSTPPPGSQGAANTVTTGVSTRGTIVVNGNKY